MKLGNVWRWVVAIRPYDIARDELWRREDHTIRMKAARCMPVAINRNYIDAIVRRDQLNHCAIELNICLDSLEQMLDETSITFRPRNQRLRLIFRRDDTRTKIK